MSLNTTPLCFCGSISYIEQGIKNIRLQETFVTAKKHFSSNDVLEHSFEFLSHEDLEKVCHVSKKWSRIASISRLWNAFVLTDLFPGLKVIDKEVWKKHVDIRTYELDFSNGPVLNRRTLIRKLRRLYTLKVQGDAGGTVLTLPKGLTLSKLIQITEKPKTGNSIKFHYIWNPILQELGETAVSETRLIFITNAVLKGSKNGSIGNQQELFNKIGCRKPDALEIATAIFLVYISSIPENPPTRLYNSINIYACCVNNVRGKPVVVGGFDSGGLIAYGYDRVKESHGIGALKEL